MGNRILFMGTPEFAVPVLDALTRTTHEIVGVFTRQDKPAGRGGKLQISPIKQLALARNLSIYQPKTLRTLESIALVLNLKPDLILVAAYGLILPHNVLVTPPRGCINTHASLLPRHRGAAPITAAILAGDEETGVTLMQMDEGIDTGPIFAQRAIRIAEEDTTGRLTEKLSRAASELLMENLSRWLNGGFQAKPQDESGATYAKTIKKEDGLIDWNLPADEIARRVRAFNPWPSAFTFWNNALLKILRAEPSGANARAEPGRVIDLKKEIAVACGSGTLVLREVQLAGKRAMGIEEFARGQRNFLSATLGKS